MPRWTWADFPLVDSAQLRRANRDASGRLYRHGDRVLVLERGNLSDMLLAWFAGPAHAVSSIGLVAHVSTWRSEPSGRSGSEPRTDEDWDAIESFMDVSVHHGVPRRTPRRDWLVQLPDAMTLDQLDLGLDRAVSAAQSLGNHREAEAVAEFVATLFPTLGRSGPT